MKYASPLSEGLALIRQHVRAETDKGAFTPGLIAKAVTLLRSEWAIEFNLPGVRYWHIPEDGSYFVTYPDEAFGDYGLVMNLAVELSRAEYLGRQGIHFGYDDTL